jgi:D-tyrosyl-tRNA(Tyr) deacylase
MRAVAQRVSSARVEVGTEVVGSIGAGLLVYLGAGKTDGDDAPAWMAQKLESLRIFEDEAGKMNRSVREAGGQVLVISQFTLYGDVRKGRRPGFDAAAPPERAEQLYESVCAALRQRSLHVQTGRFRADMQVVAQVDGPVTILIDSDRAF